MSNYNLYEHCFIELKKYSFDTYKENIPNDLFVRGLCIKEENNLVFKCTGLIVSHNKIFVIFPKGSVIPTEETVLKEHIRLLIDVLSKYSLSSTLDPIETSLLGGIGENKSFMAAAFWLIKDYFEHGIVHFQNQEYGLNQSTNINWARTINTISPVISNHQPIYLDLVTKKHFKYDHLITKIHQYAVEHCLKLYGWLFDYDGEQDKETELPCDEDTALHYLELEAHRTFHERKSNLFQNLREFILGSHTFSKESIFTFVTPYFHTVWEKICHLLFSDLNDKSIPKLPPPYWSVGHKVAKTEQIPDIMFRKEKKLFILDAKYYRVDYAPFKLPGWGDLVKQFFYRHTLLENENEGIENIFIFPGQSHQGLEYLGFAAVEGIANLGQIRGFIVDVVEGMKYYVNNQKGEFRDKLLMFY
ncbi:LlaJI family restriction endonuclease [Cytobacillus gottheilii]|uniref:LlaJI family restriction endonuclease n=1 Tax=Cytobacillus gottheilii TaxID=859144 RepID=UPI001593B764|nr:LlaJI family restriction endonuclease [Cytobacillus gottheilii]